MRPIIAAYREDNDNIEFKFIHVFARIETLDKWTETRTALAKGNTAYDPTVSPTPATNGRHVGNKKSKTLRDVAPTIKKLHSSIMACMADAATHGASG
jgi:hypothetical protein